MRHPDARTSARKRLPKSLTAAVAGAAAAAIALPSAISYADPVPTPAPAPAPAPAQPFAGFSRDTGFGRDTGGYAPAPAAAPAPRDEPRDAGNGRGGWMSDLLRRASRDEEAAPAATPARANAGLVESLNTLSADIARAIDDDTFLDLWDRHRAGERAVFNRRLYTLQGQQTYEEIRRKYQRDADFRTAVDRYVEDFENLLKEVSRSDRNGVMGQSYLTSDTGKVYTLLAHASGRFE